MNVSRLKNTINQRRQPLSLLILIDLLSGACQQGIMTGMINHGPAGEP